MRLETSLVDACPRAMLLPSRLLGPQQSALLPPRLPWAFRIYMVPSSVADISKGTWEILRSPSD